MKKMFIAISLLFSLTITSSNAVEVSVEAKITGLYVAYFNRAADQAGLKYWTDKADEVAKQGDDVSSVFKTLSAGFATHPTFKSTYEHLGNKAFVEAIYRNALGRDGDAEGIGYWTDLLDRVIMNRPDMVATFVELSMVKDLTKENFPNLTDEELAAAQLRQDLITNKVRIAVTFTNQLDTLSNVVNSNAPESDPAYLASIKIISEVNEDVATVTAVLAFLDKIIDHNTPIAQINGVGQIVINGIIHNVSNVAEFRQALEDAALNSSNDVIILEKGAYSTAGDSFGTFIFNDSEEYNLTIKSAEGLTSNDVILDGNDTHQVFKYNNSFDTGGYTNQSSATLTFQKISITNGRSDYKGAGISVSNSLKILDCNISNNIMKSSRNYYNYGGGFYVQEGDVLIENSTFEHNIANGSGGGFYIFYGAGRKAIITNSIFSNNKAGGIGAAFSASTNKGMIITNSKFLNNSAQDNGGAVHIEGGATIDNCTFLNNSSNYNGGGAYLGSSATIKNSIFSDNSAVAEGGGCFSDSRLIMTNTLFSNNIAKNGSGVSTKRLHHNYGTSLMSNNTFVGHKEALHSKGVFINNIFSNNDIDIQLHGDSHIYNNYIDYLKITGASNYVIIKKNNLQQTVVGDIEINEDNLTLKSISPVIDMGLNPENLTFKKLLDDYKENLRSSTDFYAILYPLLGKDIFGNNRIYNSTIDMGAVEYGSSK